MEQRYRAVLAVIADGRGVGEITARFGVSKQSVHARFSCYEDYGLDGLANLSRKPTSIPNQMPAAIEGDGGVVGSFTSLLCMLVLEQS